MARTLNTELLQDKKRSLPSMKNEKNTEMDSIKQKRAPEESQMDLEARMKRRRTASAETAHILASMSTQFWRSSEEKELDTSTKPSRAGNARKSKEKKKKSYGKDKKKMKVGPKKQTSVPDKGLSRKKKNAPAPIVTSLPLEEKPAREVTMEELRKYFDKPIVQVAKEFGICITLMKKICRRNGIKRWPHRQMRSLNKSIASMEAAMCCATEDEKARYLEQIQNLKMKRAAVLYDPSGKDIPKSVLKKLMWEDPPSESLTPTTKAPVPGGLSPSKFVGSDQDDTDEELGSEQRGGRWTPAEHNAFLEGIRMYGKDWRRVSQVVGTRNAVQTRTHAQKYLFKNPAPVKTKDNGRAKARSSSLTDGKKPLKKRRLKQEASESTTSSKKPTLIPIANSHPSQPFNHYMGDSKLTSISPSQAPLLLSLPSHFRQFYENHVRMMSGNSERQGIDGSAKGAISPKVPSAHEWPCNAAALPRKGPTHGRMRTDSATIRTMG